MKIGNPKKNVSDVKCVKIITNYVNPDTGELLDSHTEADFKSRGEGEFVRMYVSKMEFMLDLTPSEFKAMVWIMRNMDYEKNFVMLTADERDEIAEVCGVKPRQVLNLIKELRNNGVILPKLSKNQKMRKGWYMTNPFLFSRASAVRLREHRNEWCATLAYLKKAKSAKEMEKLLRKDDEDSDEK